MDKTTTFKRSLRIGNLPKELLPKITYEIKIYEILAKNPDKKFTISALQRELGTKTNVAREVRRLMEKGLAERGRCDCGWGLLVCLKKTTKS